jgi:hypothetical protein
MSEIPPRNRAERRAAARAKGRRAAGTALTATKIGALVATSATAAFIAAPSAGAATTITVTDPGNSGAGTLRDALANANNGDTIVFAPAVTTVSVTSRLKV